MKRSPMKRGTSVLRRTELKRGVIPPKRTALARSGGIGANPGKRAGTSLTPRKSKRLRKYEAEFEAMRPLVKARSGGLCEVPGWTLGCEWTGAMNLATTQWAAHSDHHPVATHIHHRRYRTRGGTNSLDNLLHVCIGCHDWIHQNGGTGGMANLLGLALGADESEARG